MDQGHIGIVFVIKNTSSINLLDTTCPLPDAYSPSYVESTWYAWWEKEVNHKLLLILY